MSVHTSEKRRTMRVSDCAEILGLGRSAMYQLVRQASETGVPFKVLRLGSSYLVSRQSFEDFLTNNGL